MREAALHGLMMVLDGVTESLENEMNSIRIKAAATLTVDGNIVQSLDLMTGSGGMCIGFQGWREGDFGDQLLVVAPPGDERNRGSKND